MKRESVQSEIQASVRQVRLAGLGAFSKVQKESVRLFETLVEEGKKVEAERGEATKAPFLAPLKALGDNLREQAQELQEKVEARVDRAMNRVGVPAKEDIQALSIRLDEIQQSMKELVAARKPVPHARKAAVREVEEAA